MKIPTTWKLLVINLLLIYFPQLTTSFHARLQQRNHFNHLEEAEEEASGGYDQGLDLAAAAAGGQFGSNSRSIDDYDDEGLASGWGDSSGDYLPVPAENFCAFPGLKSRRSGDKIQLQVTLENLCGSTTTSSNNNMNTKPKNNNNNNREVEARKRCLKAVCQCFGGEGTYSVHFENHFAIECIATTAAGAAGGGGGTDHRGGRSTLLPPRARNTLSPSNNNNNNGTTKFFSDYDDDDNAIEEEDEDEEEEREGEEEEDGDYSVEIDRSRVVEVEKSQEHGGILRKTGLLASIMGGTIIGLLCAVLLSMFIVYRVKRGRCPGRGGGGRYPSEQPYGKSPHCPPLKGYTKNFDDCDYYA